MKTTLSDLCTGKNLPRELQLQRLRLVIQHELTELQRQTLLDYYFNGKKLHEIAEERQVTVSTAARTLKRAEDKLRRFMQY